MNIQNNEKPILSIVTINFNNSEGLKKTIESVRVQTCHDYEHIIIDGGSTDNSVEIIKQNLEDSDYAKRVTFWCSEKDNGIYNAMNKGISHSNGEYVLILNSADTLSDENIINKVKPLLDGTDIISGILEGENFKKIPDKDFSLFSYIDSYVPHGATFVKANICKTNPFDETYKIIADYDFFYRILSIKGITYKTIPLTIEIFDLSGVSTQRPPLQKEEMDRFLNSVVPQLAWKDYELYENFSFFEQAINKSKIWYFIYKVCRKLIHIFMRIG